MAARHRLDPSDERVARFFADRHLATLTTPRTDGTPHVVPVGVTFDPAAGLARVITSAGSAKARHVAAPQRRIAGFERGVGREEVLRDRCRRWRRREVAGRVGHGDALRR